MSDKVTHEELDAAVAHLTYEQEQKIMKLEDSVNLIWSELQKLNRRVENVGNAFLSGETDDGK